MDITLAFSFALPAIIFLSIGVSIARYGAPSPLGAIPALIITWLFVAFVRELFGPTRIALIVMVVSVLGPILFGYLAWHIHLEVRRLRDKRQK